jgi:carbon monoxide dehydrogenase subunit G
VLSSNEAALVGGLRAGGKVKVEGSYTFDAPRDRVWSVLLNPEALKACVPGLESLTPTGENAYEANLKVGVAAIRGSYKGNIKLSDLVEPSSYKMQVDGKGGAGFVRGIAEIELVDQGATTLVNVKGDGNVGGTVAGVGQRMLGGVAKMLMGQFFDCLKKQL